MSLYEDYERGFGYDFEITVKILPRACTECPFWGLDTRTCDEGLCLITGTAISAVGQQDEKRMNDCPIIQRGEE